MVLVTEDRDGNAWNSALPIQVQLCCFCKNPIVVVYAASPPVAGWVFRRQTGFDVIVSRGVWGLHSIER